MKHDVSPCFTFLMDVRHQNYLLMSSRRRTSGTVTTDVSRFYDELSEWYEPCEVKIFQG